MLKHTQGAIKTSCFLGKTHSRLYQTHPGGSLKGDFCIVLLGSAVRNCVLFLTILLSSSIAKLCSRMNLTFGRCFHHIGRGRRKNKMTFMRFIRRLMRCLYRRRPAGRDCFQSLYTSLNNHSAIPACISSVRFFHNSLRLLFVSWL
jgi:hypothetical protein